MRGTMPGLRRVRGLVVAACVSLSLAACGSQLAPEEVAAVSARGPGVQTADGVADLGTQTTGDLPDGTTEDGLTPDTSGDDVPDGSGDTPTTDTPGTDANTPQGQSNPIKTPTAAQCANLKNGTGITDSEIVVGEVADVSGPVPGLFQSGQDAAKAFVNYFNTTNPQGLCGRKLVLKTYDSRTDAAADFQAYTKGCEEVFAMVGSVTAIDYGGAKVAQDCGLPDIRGGAFTPERNACTTCFGSQSTSPAAYQNAVPDFIKSKYGDASQHVAYLASGGNPSIIAAQVRAMTKRGLKFDYVAEIDTSEFNYAPYVQQLKERGIEVVFFQTAYQLSAKMRVTMQQQGYTPKLYLRDPTDYHPGYIKQGGSAVEDTVVFMNFTPFEEGDQNQEMGTYLAWLQQTVPGATPDFFGVFAWSAYRMFIEKATELGSDLNRASLVATVKAENKWTGNGMHASQPVGTKGTGECWRFVQLKQGKWVPISPKPYTCSGITPS